MVEADALKVRCSLVVMAKAPVPGKVKTRLIPFVGPQRATQVYQRLLANTLRALTVNDISRVLSCTPDTQHAMLRNLSRQYGWQRQQQPLGDLGGRMSKIISQYQRDSHYTILVGSDIANMNMSYIKQSIDNLNNGHDLVLGATEDGGYGLIAMPRLYSGLFRGIPWSTDRVLKVTLTRARQMKLKTAVIKGLWDVDTYAEYKSWIKDQGLRIELTP